MAVKLMAITELTATPERSSTPSGVRSLGRVWGCTVRQKPISFHIAFTRHGRRMPVTWKMTFGCTAVRKEQMKERVPDARRHDKAGEISRKAALSRAGRECWLCCQTARLEALMTCSSTRPPAVRPLRWHSRLPLHGRFVCSVASHAASAGEHGSHLGAMRRPRFQPHPLGLADALAFREHIGTLVG